MQDHAGRIDHRAQPRGTHVGDHCLDTGPTARLVEERAGPLLLQGPLHGENDEWASVFGDQPPTAIVFQQLVNARQAG